MEPNQIKNAHILDILFDGRNKEYGAYELRKTYNRRMVKSMAVMGSIVLLLLLGGVVSGLGKAKRAGKIEVGGDVELKSVTDPPPPPVAQIRMTVVRIVPDDQVTQKEKPPENDAADRVQIGTVNKDGITDDGTPGPLAGSGTAAGVVVAPKRADGDLPFETVEIEASFPGGVPAWARFLNKNFRYPDEAMSQGLGGTVVVQFVIDLDGNVSDVKAISGPEGGGLREEAERVIRKSGKWIPAVQNGRNVKAYRRQPVRFLPTQDN